MIDVSEVQAGKWVIRKFVEKLGNEPQARNIYHYWSQERFDSGTPDQGWAATWGMATIFNSKEKAEARLFGERTCSLCEQPLIFVAPARASTGGSILMFRCSYCQKEMSFGVVRPGELVNY